MKRSIFILYYLLLLLIQILLSKYAQIGPFLYFSLIPAMVLSISASRPTYLVMLAAFASGLVIDVLSDGMLGLNAGAATLASALQKPVIRFFVDPDIVDRGYMMSYKRYGHIRVISALVVLTLGYFLMYTTLDNAGYRSVGFISLKTLLSSLGSLPLGAVALNLLCPYQR